jgi:hypothetical protein
VAHIGDAFHPARRFRTRVFMVRLGDSHPWSANVRGHRVRRLPDGCKGYGWVLMRTTANAEALHGFSKAVPGAETSNPE